MLHEENKPSRTLHFFITYYGKCRKRKYYYYLILQCFYTKHQNNTLSSAVYLFLITTHNKLWQKNHFFREGTESVQRDEETRDNREETFSMPSSSSDPTLIHQPLVAKERAVEMATVDGHRFDGWHRFRYRNRNRLSILAVWMVISLLLLFAC